MTRGEPWRLRVGRPAVPTLVLALALCVPELARADLLDEGVDRYNAGEFERSLQLLRRARATLRGAKELGRLHLYIGLDHAFLGRTRPARDAFAAALSYDPLLDLDPQQIKEQVVALFRSVRAGLHGDLRVSADAPAVTVFVDGREQGSAPLLLRLGVGAHRIDARHGGRVVHSAVAVISVGRTAAVQVSVGVAPRGSGSLVVRSMPAGATVRLDGRRVGRAPLVLDEVASGGHDVTLELDGKTERREVHVNAGRRARLEVQLGSRPAPRRRLWTWIAAGGAVALAAIGFGMWGWGESQLTEYREPGLSKQRWRELEDSIPPKYIAAQTLLGLAAGMAATSVVLFFLEGRRVERRRAVRLEPVLGTASGAVLRGSF